VTSLLLDPHSGQIVDANRAACDFYGYSRAEILSMRIQDINALPAAEVARKRMEALKEQTNYFLFPHRLKSGDVRMVEVFSYPVKYSGRPLLISLVIDASRRKTRGRHFQGDYMRDWLSLSGQGTLQGIPVKDWSSGLNLGRVGPTFFDGRASSNDR